MVGMGDQVMKAIDKGEIIEEAKEAIRKEGETGGREERFESWRAKDARKEDIRSGDA